jgi:hypothetical protein
MTRRPAAPPPDLLEVRRTRPRQVKLLLISAILAAVSGALVAGVGTATAGVAPRTGPAAEVLATTPAPSTTPNTSPNPCPTGATTGPTSTARPTPINNGDTQPPTRPGPLVVTSCPNGIVVVEWIASTDNVGVAYYAISRLVGDIAFSYTAFTNRIFLPAASGTYSYHVQAIDAAGNRSEGSSLIVGNPNCPPPMPQSCSSSPTSASPTGPDTQPPTTPGQPVVTVANGVATITWAASTDNVGVANYILYDRYTDVVQIRTLPGTTTTYQVTLNNLQHSFWLVARDAAGNQSPSSPTTTVGTPEPCPPLAPCTPTTPNPIPPLPCFANYTVLSEWPGAFQGQVTVRNALPSTLTGWQVRWSFANGQQISQLWSGSYTQTGAEVTVTNPSWNATIPPNGTITFGFIATWTGTNTRPSAFRLNGNLCGAGT